MVAGVAEQLDRAEAAMERMEGDLNTADWLLRGMRSYTGALVNYFVAPPPHEPAVTESKRRPVQRKTRSSSMNRGDIVIGTHIGTDICTASEAYFFFLQNRRRRGVGADGVRQACE
mgnify:FL=1